jgi:hypothetical protein
VIGVRLVLRLVLREATLDLVEFWGAYLSRDERGCEAKGIRERERERERLEA